MTHAERWIALRRRAGLTQKEFIKALNLSDDAINLRSIQEFEQGRKVASRPQVAVLELLERDDIFNCVFNQSSQHDRQKSAAMT